MSTSVGLFEANVYFTSPFGVIFSVNLTGQSLLFFCLNLTCHAY